MFDKVQMEVMKKAAKIDSGKQCLTRTADNFPYLYGYTKTKDVVIMNNFAAHVIPGDLVYLNPETVFRSMKPLTTESVSRLLDDSAAENAEMTSELVQIGDKLTHVFETASGERVYIDTKLFKPFKDLKTPLTFKASKPICPVFVYTDTGRKLGLVLPVRPEGYDNKRRH